jgi:hypothetical protein
MLSLTRPPRAGGCAMSCQADREEAGATPRNANKSASFTKASDGDVSIPLASLPEYVQEKLAAFDTDGDGFITLAEILRHGAELEKSKASVTHYRRIVALLLCAWAVSLAAVFGVVTAGVAVTRQTLVSRGSALMTTRDGDTIVQTARATATYAASSALNDEYWQELSHLTIYTNESWVRLGVTGTARVGGSGTYGSVIQVMTTKGVMTLDGEVASYDADLLPLLQANNMVAMSSNGRHLLQGYGTSGNNVTVMPTRVAAPVASTPRPPPPRALRPPPPKASGR